MKHEARQHRRDQLARIDDLTAFGRQNFRIGDEIAVHLRRELDRELDGLVVDKQAKFQLSHDVRSVSPCRAQKPDLG
jgi:hypothetical protein